MQFHLEITRDGMHLRIETHGDTYHPAEEKPAVVARCDAANTSTRPRLIGILIHRYQQLTRGAMAIRSHTRTFNTLCGNSSSSNGSKTADARRQSSPGLGPVPEIRLFTYEMLRNTVELVSRK